MTQGSLFSSFKTEVLAADPAEFLLWAVIAALVSLVSGFAIFRNVRRARLIEDTPTSKIRSAAQGYVELIGQGSYFNNNPVLAPLTLSQCLWYQFLIEKKEVRHTRRGRQTYWRTVESKSSSEYFKINDETGHCVVNPVGAEVHPQHSHTWYGHTRWPDKASVLNTSRRNFFNSGDYRYTEKRIHQGEQLYMLGNFRSVGPDADKQAIQQNVSRLLNSWKKQQQALLERFDKNNDGEIDLNEWQKVREAAYQVAINQHNQDDTEIIEHFLERTSFSNQPFIVSTKPAKELTRKFRFYAILSVIIFTIVMPLFIWMLYLRFTN